MKHKNVFWIVVFSAALLIMCSCAKQQASLGNTNNKTQGQVSEKIPEPGSFAPGYAIKRNVGRLTNFFKSVTEPVTQEVEKPEQEVLMAEKEETESVEEKPIGEVFKSSASNPRVFIKAGDCKKKKNKQI